VNCTETQKLLHGYLDGELDLVNNVAVERHVQECAACAATWRRNQALRDALRGGSLSYAPPADLRQRVRASLRRASNGSAVRRVLPWRVLGLAASFAAGVLLTVVLVRPVGPQPAGDALAQQVISSHVRSLMAEHLKDVDSTDQHTVKPWFTGRLDFAPPVVNLAAEEFPLVGGRLDYVDDRPVAGLVYLRHKHVINLLVWPTPGSAETSPRALSGQGYHLVQWSQAGMTWWAVSDLNADELQQFAELIRSHTR
jgi:anti-sigma factor RsiW